MCKRIVVLIVFIVVIVFCSIDVRSYDFSLPKTIKVEVKGEVEDQGIYEIEVGSNVEDLMLKCKMKKSADTSRISYLHILRNNEVISIPKKNNTSLISINNANLYELSSLPGIGKSTALKIIDYREKYGSFLTLDSLKNISGIGDIKYEKIKHYICL